MEHIFRGPHHILVPTGAVISVPETSTNSLKRARLIRTVEAVDKLHDKESSSVGDLLVTYDLRVTAYALIIKLVSFLINYTRCIRLGYQSFLISFIYGDFYTAKDLVLESGSTSSRQLQAKVTLARPVSYRGILL